MKITIYQAPYDSGRRGARMGKGPEHLVQNGLVTRLWSLRCETEVKLLESAGNFSTEVSTAIELAGLLSESVSRSIREGAFPLVLSGNCNGAWGTLSGLSAASLEKFGVIWFDAHGDFNTPETTLSGYLDGMALASAAGLCWKKLMAGIPGFRAVPPENILHVGGRDFDPGEAELLLASGAGLVSPEELRVKGVREALAPVLDALAGRVSSLYLHLDLDVLDPELTPANQYRAPGGLTPGQVIEAIRAIREKFTIAACGVASYDPNFDAEGRTLQAGLDMIESVLSSPASG